MITESTLLVLSDWRPVCDILGPSCSDAFAPYTPAARPRQMVIGHREWEPLDTALDREPSSARSGGYGLKASRILRALPSLSNALRAEDGSRSGGAVKMERSHGHAGSYWDHSFTIIQCPWIR